MKNSINFLFWNLPLSDNSASAEFTVSNDEQVMMRIYSKEKTGQDHLTAPVFNISPETASIVTLGDWHLVQPIVK